MFLSASIALERSPGFRTSVTAELTVPRAGLTEGQEIVGVGEFGLPAIPFTSLLTIELIFCSLVCAVNHLGRDGKEKQQKEENDQQRGARGGKGGH